MTPFRADHVGSLLRPERLKKAREELLGPHTATDNLGPHNHPELRLIEDECIREAVAMQERTGLRAVTDGEFRRRSWTSELMLAWRGFSATRVGSTPLKWRNESGAAESFSETRIVSQIDWRPGAIVPAFKFLKSVTKAVPKVNLPAPDVIHYSLGGSDKIDRGIYPNEEAFWADLIAAYRKEVADLVSAGVKYIQFDDTSFAFLCDPEHREYVSNRGDDPKRLLERYAEAINAALEGVPTDVYLTLHQCRGNREGKWGAEGDYEPVADLMFNRINVHAYFLEYDTARSGGFEPLRFLPKGKTAVLGLVSTKTPVLESVDALRYRLDEAARHVPLEQLAISPQCGFASSYMGNPLSEGDEKAKLARLVEVADKVWGSV